MHYGVPTEVRDLEKRVGLTPAGVLALTQAGHTVYVQRGAGAGAGFSDDVYRHAGANIAYSASEVYGRADIIAKIARPTADEHELFRPGQTIFSFFHLAVASPDLYQALVAHNITAVSYEMIQEDGGDHPVLIPASEVAGRLAPIIAGGLLRSNWNDNEGSGLGILLGGLPGVPAAAVVIVGGGVLGLNAARVFRGLGAEVTVLDKDVAKLRLVERTCQASINTMVANEYNLKRAVKFADVLVGAVMMPGERAPVLITRDMVKSMRPRSIIIDFSIDEGGCVETSRPTTLRDPVFVSEGVIHHCVPNLTASVSRTTSYAIVNAALPFLQAVGDHGLLAALRRMPALRRGVNLFQGNLSHARLAQALGREVTIDLSKEIPS